MALIIQPIILPLMILGLSTVVPTTLNTGSGQEANLTSSLESVLNRSAQTDDTLGWYCVPVEKGSHMDAYGDGYHCENLDALFGRK